MQTCILFPAKKWNTMLLYWRKDGDLMFIADLHIHSKYSRATSRDGIPEFLELWARKKGITLLGTGDFTHPAWREELHEKLIPAEDGLYTLREGFRLSDETATASSAPRFIISGEISSIYKKKEKVRKVHNLILLPSLEAAETLSRRLEVIGNIHSDGRPILGLDSRDLLEITLEACPEAIFIPAHIWTPHFSMFGAFSGFNTIEECFEDLTPHIHALETGLSSDPPMNWRLSALDGYTLVSNSDAHSPQKLGREANLLDTELSYPSLEQAIREGKKGGFGGTIEFFPEEGKYHYDGHRNCGLCFTPAQTEECGGMCPVCGKKITIGVQHRVEELADREEGFIPEDAAHFESLVPLPEVIAASTGQSAAGKKVALQYETMLHEIGPEFYILREAPLDDIRHSAGPLVEEGIRRLREGRVERTPGFDGEYGKISLLDESEIKALSGQISLFGDPAPRKKKTAAHKKKTKSELATEIAPDVINIQTPLEKPNPLEGLNDQQKKAVTEKASTIAVIAGPGTGKTKTLVSRIAYLVEECNVKPSEITAVTFTNKAAGEMRERLTRQLGKQAVRSMHIGTFHSICLDLLKQNRQSVMIADEYETADLARAVIEELSLKLSLRDFLSEVSKRKNGITTADPSLSDNAYLLYCSRLCATGALDFDDLLLEALSIAESGEWTDQQKKRFSYLLVDEYQDINPLQIRLIEAWNHGGKNLFVIGDPDQSIYGFRGSDARCFDRLFTNDSPVQTIRFTQNYRSTPEILNCALSVISCNEGEERHLFPQLNHGLAVSHVTAESDLSEGIFIAKEINRMVGGIDMLEAQDSLLHAEGGQARGFSEIAILYRTHRQARILEKCLQKEGIPYVVTGRDDFLADDTVRACLCFFRFLFDPSDVLSLRVCLKLIWKCPEDLIQSFVGYWENAKYISLTEDLLQNAVKEYGNREFLKKWFSLSVKFLPRLHREKPQNLLSDWIKEMDLTQTEPMEQLLNASVFHTEMSEFLQNLLLGQESDLVRSMGRSYATGAVTLMTLHGSKGLEYPVVFLCGVNKGMIPLELAVHPSDQSEERRLFYVGMTRAKEELILSSVGEPSYFLSAIPAAHLHHLSAGKQKNAGGQQLSLF